MVFAAKGVLFDKDGTLIDFHSYWMPAYSEAAQHLEDVTGQIGLKHRLFVAGGWLDDVQRLEPSSAMASGTTQEVIDVWLAEAKLVPTPQIEQEIYSIFLKSGSNATPVVDLRELFDSLRANGTKLGVATMDTTRTAEELLSRFDVTDRVDFVTGYDGGFGAKPEPGMVLGFCKAVGLDPSDVAVVGDSVRDMMMAKNAKAGLAVGVLTGVTIRESLETEADVVIDSIADIHRVL